MASEVSIAQGYTYKAIAHIMIPFDNSVIAICPNVDIYNSSPYLDKIVIKKEGEYFSGFESFYTDIEDLFLANNVIDKPIEQKSWTGNSDYYYDNAISLINKIDAIPIDKVSYIYKDTTYGGKEFEYESIIGRTWLLNYSNMSFMDFLEMSLDFDKNGFKLVTKQDDLEVEKEVWSDGEFIGIRSDKYEEFLNAVNKKSLI